MNKFLGRISKLTLCILALAALCQCAQKQIVAFDKPCAGVDAYSLGRQDGAKGLPAPQHAAADELGECVPEKGTRAMRVYQTGRNSGLVEYCSRENGFNVGKSEQSYFYVCPEFMEPEFLSGYHDGIRVRRMQEERQQLARDIAELNDAIKNEPANSILKQLNQKKIGKLKTQQADLEKKLRARVSANSN
ncbi:MAG: DUF2799 domain-containing protein [Bdellovibrionales bacterium]|nr:DUF2799 domain-containing protein [Bdellovibrionales bacterium]